MIATAPSWDPASHPPDAKDLRRAGATMLLGDAAARMGMPVSIAGRVLTILPLPGRKRIATAQLESFERWLSQRASARPWYGSASTSGKTIISGGVDE